MIVPASLKELGPGSMVGEYRIEGLLGEGGMGRVYSAIHPIIAKRAAIKVLHPELSVNQEAVDRFAQEARAVNQIGHDNIVDIFAFGTLPDGRSYFVMEWMRGQSLRDRLRESPLPIQQALAALDVIAVALEAAHEVGIVHRDLKPDNIFLVEKKGAAPTVKLLDFGIAKLLGDETGRSERTQTGNLLGTPAYISPEQARGQHVDHRTDIYALGCLTYELFTGALPFPAESAADMLAKHLYEPPPSARIRNPSVPVPLDQLITAMMSKDSQYRPTLVQFREALQPYRATGFAPGAPGVMNPIHTPARISLGSAAAYHTPMPGTLATGPTMATSTGGMNAVHAGPGLYTANETSPVRKGVSKTGAIIGGVIAVAAAAAVTMAVIMSGGDKKPATPPSTEPAVNAVVAPPPKVDEPKATVETKPVDSPKADDTKPVEVKNTDDTKPVEVKKDPVKGGKTGKVGKTGKGTGKGIKPNQPDPDRDDAL